ncbi:MAG: hypothetical protein LBR37_02485 [Erysipelotrichaceae bacterium]|jgi:deoxyadenosine/deoxycytidine kinase|nr:hypothetical protein [Erysipelotrichaceae bacterium]
MRKILIIAGDLASGKSTLARQLSNYFKIPFYTKEHFKEILGDEIPYAERELNKKLSVSAIKLLIHILERTIECDGDVILEANFKNEDLQKIKDECDLRKREVLLIYLKGDVDVLFERFMHRTYYQNRHPVHLTHPLSNIDDFERYVMEYRSVHSVIPRHELDVTNANYQIIFAKALEIIKSQGGL